MVSTTILVEIVNRAVNMQNDLLARDTVLSCSCGKKFLGISKRQRTQKTVETPEIQGEKEQWRRLAAKIGHYEIMTHTGLHTLDFAHIDWTVSPGVSGGF